MRWRDHDWKGIIPAYAGSTKPIRAHAHIPPGSSPHTRGAQRRRIGDQMRARIIPAYAGSTPFTAAPPRMDRDHPRIRGEHFLMMVYAVL